MIVKYPPIQGGVSVQNYWLAQAFSELGHDVCVLTNAEEVEDEYRIFLSDEDAKLLKGFRKKNTIRVISTHSDQKEVFIPQTRPFLTKLVSRGLEVVHDFNPDLIYSHYVEPYGIAALYLSKLTGIPYTVKHAGSDLGKLGKLSEMRVLHERVYRDAKFVLTSPRHYAYFHSIGICENKLTSLGFFPWAPDVFYGTEPQNQDEKLRLLIYGKTGPNKGTSELLNALCLLANGSFPFHLTAHWGGRSFQEYRQTPESMELVRKSMVSFKSYVPHWKIAENIRASDAVLFLENQFGISIHTPGIPFEVLSCNRLLITTKEIANKYPRVVTEENSIVIPEPESRISPKGVADVICEAGKRKQVVHQPHFDSSELYANGIAKVEMFLGKVAELV